MSIKERIDSLSPSDVAKFIKEHPEMVNDFIEHRGNSVPLLYYMIEKGQPLKVVELLIRNGAIVNTPVIDWQKLLLTIDTAHLSLLMKHGLKIGLSGERYKRILVELFIRGDVARVISFHKLELIDKQQILAAIQSRDLIANALDFMYQQIGQLCRQYKLNMSQATLGRICMLEKNYIHLFKLIRNNNLELKDIANVGQITQMVFNSYLFHLIDYCTDMIDHSTLVNVNFYHYSNFPVINKAIMGPIYNDANFARIELLLREKFFIKKIIRKKTGIKTIPFDGSINSHKITIELMDDAIDAIKQKRNAAK